MNMTSSEVSVENSKATLPSSTPNCLLLSSWFSQNPFLRPLKPNLPSPNSTMRDLHSSLASTSDKCLSFLHLFASQNPILKRMLSFSSDFKRHLITQIQCRDYRNKKSLSNHNFAAILPGDSVAGIVVVNGISNFLNIYNTLLIVRLVLTWFPNTPPAIVSPLSTLCDPYLNIFRGIIPPLGGTLDLSPILAFLVLNAFTSTAAALPAELPEAGAPRSRNDLCHAVFTTFTSSQQKWMRRLNGNKPQNSAGAN
ncbi:ylmG homolog protein 2, chloroplastic [Euphorbia lathyris]|uniref:ylmG homolog protein 2, chloroplastic n=1 Tax=Euphorbia lathyris TaxID=212925 RepID=UPI003313FE77